MNSKRGFNEVMIVNPYEPGSEPNQGVKLMRFYNAPQPVGHYGGYYGEPAEMYSYYAAAPTGYGYYSNLSGYYGEIDPNYAEYEPAGYYGAYEPVGYYSEYEPVSYYGAYEPMAYYSEYEPAGHYGEYGPMAYYSEYEPTGYYGEHEPVAYYGESPEMPGYAEYDPGMQPGIADYGGGYAGYVREARPRYNAGCPMPTNVHGMGEAETIQGYVRPSTVNPSCGQFTPQPGQEPQPPDNFKPLW